MKAKTTKVTLELTETERDTLAKILEENGSKIAGKILHKLSGSLHTQNEQVAIECYGEVETTTREHGIKFYKDCMRNSEGCECERYTNIVMGLEAGFLYIKDDGSGTKGCIPEDVLKRAKPMNG